MGKRRKRIIDELWGNDRDEVTPEPEPALTDEQRRRLARPAEPLFSVGLSPGVDPKGREALRAFFVEQRREHGWPADLEEALDRCWAAVRVVGLAANYRTSGGRSPIATFDEAAGGLSTSGGELEWKTYRALVYDASQRFGLVVEALDHLRVMLRDGQLRAAEPALSVWLREALRLAREERSLPGSHGDPLGLDDEQFLQALDLVDRRVRSAAMLIADAESASRMQGRPRSPTALRAFLRAATELWTALAERPPTLSGARRETADDPFEVFCLRLRDLLPTEVRPRVRLSRSVIERALAKEPEKGVT